MFESLTIRLAVGVSRFTLIGNAFSISIYVHFMHLRNEPSARYHLGSTYAIAIIIIVTVI